MKLTKTVLAVAIAGIAATPMMASATTTLSGYVGVQFEGSDNDACTTSAEPDAAVNLSDPTDPDSDSICRVNSQGEAFEEGDARIASNDVNVGVSASQALNSGLTGYGSVRIDVDTLSSGSSFTADNVYVGVKGGFGDLRLGEVANPGEYGQLLDIINDMGVGIDAGIGYEGSFGGATVGASYSPAPNQDVFGVGAKFAWSGLSIGVGMQNLDESTNISAQVGFSYAGASIGIGMNQIEDGFTSAAGATDDETAIGVKVGYSIAGVGLAVSFQQEQESEDQVIRLDANYDLGGGLDISTRINSNSGATSADDSSDWRILLGKSF